jgi:Holliday junction DNA helicase RuvA
VGAIRAGDYATLTKIPGIGKKTAERVVLELKDKLDDMAGFTAEGVVARPSLGATAEDVLSALVNLGYPRPVAQKAVESAAKDAAVAGDFERLFRAAMVAVR